MWANKGLAENRDRFAGIAPALEEIRSEHRGEEQAEKILELYKSASYNPYLGLKSSLVLAAQIPIFVWVFVGVSGSQQLHGQHFWLIEELNQPDHLLSLGGLSVNALPIFMAITSIANLYHIAHLRNMDRSQVIAGWAITLGFLVLLYGAPSALVIYWTANIVLQWLIDVLILKNESRKRTSG